MYFIKQIIDNEEKPNLTQFRNKKRPQKRILKVKKIPKYV